MKASGNLNKSKDFGIGLGIDGSNLILEKTEQENSAFAGGRGGDGPC